jgi:signal peptidase I
MRLIREIVLCVILAAALFFIIDGVTARSYVDGQSMEPNLHKDQVLLISRLGISGVTGRVYAATHQDDASAPAGAWVPARGSIVTFVHPTDPSRVLVKRVIGLPGDTISIDNGVVKINGKPLDEPYLSYRDTRTMPVVKVPNDALFLLGDNRPASNDSRVFGAVPLKNLVGVAVLRYWPLDQLKLLVGSSS